MAKVDIHPTVQRASNLSILGNLTLKAGVEVGANVTFYPDVVVGENTRILPGRGDRASAHPRRNNQPADRDS